jgi:hypothetical protein
MPFCRNCGKEVNDGAKICGSCGAAMGVVAGAPAVNNSAGVSSAGTVNQNKPINIESHMVKAILSTCLCCLPFGIVSIVYAAKVKPALLAQDENAAREASKKANFWSNLSIILGIVISGIYFVSLGSLAIPRFSEASEKAKMAEAPRVLASFESSYLAATAEYGDGNFTAKDLMFVEPESEIFTYAIVTNQQGKPVACHATVKSSIGEFSGKLITEYDNRNQAFNHRVEPEGMEEKVRTMVPGFFQ